MGQNVWDSSRFCSDILVKKMSSSIYENSSECQSHLNALTNDHLRPCERKPHFTNPDTKTMVTRKNYTYVSVNIMSLCFIKKGQHMPRGCGNVPVHITTGQTYWTKHSPRRPTSDAEFLHTQQLCGQLFEKTAAPVTAAPFELNRHIPRLMSRQLAAIVHRANRSRRSSQL